MKHAGPHEACRCRTSHPPSFCFFPCHPRGRSAWPPVPSNIPGPPNRVGIGFRVCSAACTPTTRWERGKPGAVFARPGGVRSCTMGYSFFRRAGSIRSRPIESVDVMASAWQLVAKAGKTFERVCVDPDSAWSGQPSSGKERSGGAGNICRIFLDRLPPSLSPSSDSISVFSNPLYRIS